MCTSYLSTEAAEVFPYINMKTSLCTYRAFYFPFSSIKTIHKSWAVQFFYKPGLFRGFLKSGHYWMPCKANVLGFIFQVNTQLPVELEYFQQSSFPLHPLLINYGLFPSNIYHKQSQRVKGHTLLIANLLKFTKATDCPLDKGRSPSNVPTFRELLLVPAGKAQRQPRATHSQHTKESFGSGTGPTVTHSCVTISTISNIHHITKQLTVFIIITVELLGSEPKPKCIPADNDCEVREA